ncbi:hypothetical protein JNK13_03005 [bacterium]|nr:hypothetical protein [bacterium]
MTKDEIKTYLTEIETQLTGNQLPSIHALLALDGVFRLPNAHEMLDEEVKTHAKNVWNKVKAAGLHLEDPPILFGFPKAS